MYYDNEILFNMSSSTCYDVDLSKLGVRVKNSIIRALQQGVLPYDSGSAATTYSVLADAYGIPSMYYSARSGCLTLKNIPGETSAALQDMWNLDRVTYRMENPEQWNKYTKNADQHRYYHNIISMPDFIRDGLGVQGISRVSMLTRSVKGANSYHTSLLLAAQAFTDKQTYKGTVAPLIEKVQSGSIVQIKSFNKQIKGV